MSGFFNKIKESFASKPPPPKYRHYSSTELKVIAMKTRIILETTMDTMLQYIRTEDQQFKYAGQDPHKLYNILQSISTKVI